MNCLLADNSQGLFALSFVVVVVVCVCTVGYVMIHW